jgi:hypothetical protein
VVEVYEVGASLAIHVTITVFRRVEIIAERLPGLRLAAFHFFRSNFMGGVSFGNQFIKVLVHARHREILPS